MMKSFEPRDQWMLQDAVTELLMLANISRSRTVGGTKTSLRLKVLSLMEASSLVRPGGLWTTRGFREVIESRSWRWGCCLDRETAAVWSAEKFQPVSFRISTGTSWNSTFEKTFHAWHYSVSIKCCHLCDTLWQCFAWKHETNGALFSSHQ